MSVSHDSIGLRVDMVPVSCLAVRRRSGAAAVARL
jgi:hypothetical protein